MQNHFIFMMEFTIYLSSLVCFPNFLKSKTITISFISYDVYLYDKAKKKYFAAFKPVVLIRRQYIDDNVYKQR